MNWEIKNNIPFFKICIKKNDFFSRKITKVIKKCLLKRFLLPVVHLGIKKEKDCPFD